MRTIRAFLIRLAGSFGMQRRDGEFAEEIESLLEMHTEENRRAGMAPAEARRRAVLEIGGVEPLKEAYRDRIGLPLLGALAQDLRYACRALWKSPGFTSIAVLSLALGIGANTAIFTLVNDILLKWLPVREPEQLVALGSNRQNGPYLYCYKIYTELRDRNTVFSGLFARNWFEFYFDAGGETETLNVEMVSGNYFETLGVNAYIGRTLSPEDDRTPGAHPVAVLSYDFWVSRFGADPGAIGKTVHIQGHPFTIVGVTPPSFFGVNSGMSQPIRVPWSMATVLRPPSGSWNPFDEPGKGFRHSEPYQLFARLKPGISIEQAQAALEPLFASIRREHADALDWVNIPGTSNQWPAVVSATDYRRFVDRRLAVAPVGRGFAGLKVRFRQPLLALMALVGVLLLISCSTMANLLLARSTARQREIAVRMALGAGRFRLICQSLLESLLLAVSGGALGVLVAWWGAGALAAIIGPSAAPDFSLTALSLKVTPDLGVLAFTVAVSLLTSLLVGLAPSLHAARTTVIEALKGKGAALAGDRSHMTLRKSLIVTEVGLCVLLLAAAGLFVRTLKSLRDVHTTGFDTSRLIQMWISPDPYSRLTAEQKQQYYTELMRRLEALPGVRSAARSKALLMMSDYYGWRTVVEGREPRAIENIPWNEVSSRFFETVGVPILSGRVWSTQDDSRPTHEAVISQSLAKYFFGDRSPIGETLSTWKPGVRFQIVGVIGDMRYGRLRDDDPRAVYVAPGEFAGANNVLVGTIGDPTRLIAAVEREAKALNHEAYVHPVKTVQQQLDDLLVQDSLVARLATLFGAFAAFEAAIGLYGVVAFSVARRTREIGVRVALGATRGAILSLVLREILVVAAIGVAVGISCALVLSRFTASLLFGVAATDPLALCGAALLMATVALSAAYLPARRAMRLDPMAALREE